MLDLIILSSFISWKSTLIPVEVTKSGKNTPETKHSSLSITADPMEAIWYSQPQDERSKENAFTKRIWCETRYESQEDRGVNIHILHRPAFRRPFDHPNHGGPNDDCNHKGDDNDCWQLYNNLLKPFFVLCFARVNTISEAEAG